MHSGPFSPPVEAALSELRETILSRYPTATFDTSRDPDEPVNILLNVTVDIDDPLDVLDLVLDRLLEFQIDERIPVHVIPVRTPERIKAALRARYDSGESRLTEAEFPRQFIPDDGR